MKVKRKASEGGCQLDESVCSEIVDILRERPELSGSLEAAVNMERENGVTAGWRGFEWYELPEKPQTLKMLVLRKILKITHKTREHTLYRLTDPEATYEALKLTTLFMEDIHNENIESDEVPIDLFEDVVGYEDVKQLFLDTLYGEKENRVHFMMIGPPASAKSLFLFCLERLPKTKYVLGSRTSKAGLAEYLIENSPRYLLVDEIDKMDMQDYAVLLSLCEAGRVTETLHGKTRDICLDTTVFAACNRLKGIPEEVISRFQKLHFPTYTQQEYTEIVTHVLTRRSVDLDLALHIAEKVYFDLGSKDVRQALRVAKLAKDYVQVDSVIATLSRYTKRHIEE